MLIGIPDIWHFILASRSPRREQLLKEVGLEFDVRIKDYKEDYPLHLSGSEIAEYLAHDKALQFEGEISDHDIVITADTLALHIATALQKKIVALFGPTSVNEIELYGKGIKLLALEGCKCYYKKYCSEEISCMEKITPDMVIKAIAELTGK